jgi:Domain of unknown function (DUF5615)
MLSFYMDHHVHRSITEGLRRRGINVVTAFDDGRHEDEDEALLERAVELERIIVSQDDDLLKIATHWQRSSRGFPGVVYAIQQHIDIGGTIEYLELIAHLKTADEMRNSIEYVPTR